MIEGLKICNTAAMTPQVMSEGAADEMCRACQETSASRVEDVLAMIGPTNSPSGDYQLGYTINLPILSFFIKVEGVWTFDVEQIRFRLSAIGELDRPVVIYVSSNHFIDDAIELYGELSRDIRNLMWTRHGPMSGDTYFSAGVQAWTIADYEAPITRMRREAFSILGAEIACLVPEVRDRIRAVSILGEVHHHFPNFFDGMGYESAFDVTDYSPASVESFRTWIQEKFGDTATLNAAIDGNFASFSDVFPPSKNITEETLTSIFDHIDASSHGILTLQGWAVEKDGADIEVSVYVDGQYYGKAGVDLSRTDVVDAKPELVRANVGWRYGLDFTVLAPGLHVIDIVAHSGIHSRHIANRIVAVVDRNQSAISTDVPAGISRAEADSDELSGHMDSPAHYRALFYNPLSTYWLEFRNLQVVRYIEYFGKVLRDAGVDQDLLFCHQILPGLSGSWNADFMAVDTSLDANPAYHPGVTLYGGAAYGTAFLNYKASKNWSEYGVSEMHPISHLEHADYVEMIKTHRMSGARFISPYFISLTPDRMRGFSDHNKFLIEPENSEYNSSGYYAALADIMQNW